MLMCGNGWVACDEDDLRSYVLGRVVLFGQIHRKLYSDAQAVGATFYDAPTHLEFTYTPDPLNDGNLHAANGTIALLPLGLNFAQHTGIMAAVPVRNFSSRHPSYQVGQDVICCYAI